MTSTAKPSAVGLARALAALVVVTLLLGVAIAWPQRRLEPVRSTTVELDEPSDARHP